MTQPIKQWLLSAACALAVCLPLGSQAQMPFFNRMQNAEPTSSASSNSALAGQYFTNKQGSLIWDKATNLVWYRCSLGHSWDGLTCVGSFAKYDFDSANSVPNLINKQGGFAGFSDWRLPTVQELQSLKYGHDFNREAFPDASGSYRSSHSGSYTFSHQSGNEVPQYAFRELKFNVRLVRTNQWSDGEAAAEFSVRIPSVAEITAKRQEEQRIADLKRQEEQRIADLKRQEEQRIADLKRQEEQRVADLKRQEDERRAKAQRAAAERSFVALGAQALYLQAGKAQRNGSIEQGGVSFYASELYELIVEKFPKSEFAVKATDQLNALDRTERQGQAARQAAERQAEALRDADRNASNRAACFSEVNSCVARCRSLGMDYSGTQYCVNNCQKSCN